MRHRRDGRKLGITAEHREAMLANMVTSLFRSERIETTTPKAKEARRLAEKLITKARRGDLASRRHVARTIRDADVLKKLFTEIAPRYVDRPGGYTRISKIGPRPGDNAQMVQLELV
jgi:large subunit ribosomal protein L17